MSGIGTFHSHVKDRKDTLYSLPKPPSPRRTEGEINIYYMEESGVHSDQDPCNSGNRGPF